MGDLKLQAAKYTLHFFSANIVVVPFHCWPWKYFFHVSAEKISSPAGCTLTKQNLGTDHCPGG